MSARDTAPHRCADSSLGTSPGKRIATLAPFERPFRQSRGVLSLDLPISIGTQRRNAAAEQIYSTICRGRDSATSTGV